MSAAGAAAWAWAVEAAWQVALLALVVAAADGALSRRGLPHLRHALWLVVLAKFAVPPTLASPWSVAAAIRPSAEEGAAPAAAGEFPLATAALWLWAAGAAFVAAVAIRRSLRTRRALIAGSVPVPPRLQHAMSRAAAVLLVRRTPRLLVSRATDGFALVGAFRSLLVVPAKTVPARETEHALLHELAHHRRRDLLVALAATVVRCVFWWHPASWLAASRLADLREQCCDADVVAALGDGATAYRETLLDAARRLVAPQRTAGVAWLGGRTGLVARLDALSHAPRRRSAWQRAATTFAVAIATACTVPMGAATAPHVDVNDGVNDGADDGIELARSFLADAAAGRTRASCFQTRYAALKLAGAFAGKEGSPQ